MLVSPFLSDLQGDESLQIFVGPEGDCLPLMERGTCKVRLIRPPRLDSIDPSPTLCILCLVMVLHLFPYPCPMLASCPTPFPILCLALGSASTFLPISVQCSVSIPCLLPPA